MTFYEWLSLSLTVFGGLFGIFWQWLQTRKLRYLRIFQREAHNLRLFRALSDKNHRLQMAAAAVLIERIRNEQNRAPPEGPDHVVIIRALISVTKDAPEGRRDHGVSPELGKFIADHVADSLGAFLKRGPKVASPMKEFDWQGARLNRAWWKNIDARGVDFFGAQLNNAGLRGARLAGAVLKEASLRESTLVDADLSQADLRGANICGANLTGANLAHAQLKGAIFDETTIFPDGFNPNDASMIASVAKNPASKFSGRTHT